MTYEFRGTILKSSDVLALSRRKGNILTNISLWKVKEGNILDRASFVGREEAQGLLKWWQYSFLDLGDSYTAVCFVINN